MLLKNHYYNLNLLLSKALAHGVDSEETEKAIREDATNMYVEGQLKLKIEKLVSTFTQKAKEKSEILRSMEYQTGKWIPILFEEKEIINILNQEMLQ